MKLNRQVLFSVLTLACLTIIIHLPIGSKQILLQKDFKDFPVVIGQWDGRDDEAIPKLTAANNHLTRKYGNHTGHEIRLYIGYMEKQTEGREAAIGIRYYLGEPFESWQIDDENVDLLEIPGYSKSGINVNRCVIQRGARKHLIFYWYQVGGKFVASEYRAKISLVFNAILRNRRDGAFIYISTPVTHVMDVSQENIMDFSRLVIPILADYLPKSGRI